MSDLICVFVHTRVHPQILFNTLHLSSVYTFPRSFTPIIVSHLILIIALCELVRGEIIISI